MTLLMLPELEFAWVQQQRQREAYVIRLANLARQYARAQRGVAADSSRKEIDR
jgi:hypothetical protein